MTETRRCVVLGATGYIGGRLVPELLSGGHDVVVVARAPDKLRDVPWRHQVEVRPGDLAAPTSLRAMFDRDDVVYYLVHSLTRPDFVEVDRAAARSVGAAAANAGVGRIVYLGGIVPDGQRLSPHLASRAEVGRVLLGSGGPTTVLQAAVIIGSGSASFEMLRYLSERLPAMVTPRWVHNRVQPIAVRDVLHYLVRAAELAPDIHGAYDIGGPDVLSYLEMMRRYAVVAGLPRRLVIPVPVLTPWLSAQWVNLVTPVPRAIAIPLIESLVNEVVCHDRAVAAVIPDPPGGLTHYERAVELALAQIRNADVPTRWSDASDRPAPPTRCRATRNGPGAPYTRITASRKRPPALQRYGRSSSPSEASTGGTRSRWPGRCGVGPIGWWAASGCGGVDATPAGFTWARPSTGGG